MSLQCGAPRNTLTSRAGRPETLIRPHLLAALVLVLASTAAAWAQASTGALYGVVSDDRGAPLGEATVTLHGEQGPALRLTTNARGEFRFAGLAPGLYQGRVELAGFASSEHTDVPIHLGGTTTIDVTMAPADDDAITLVAECPLLDERKISCGTTVTAEELEKIPTPRDPWTILRQAPGVLLDRVDVAGSEAAHPAAVRAPAVPLSQNVYSVDGVNLDDPAALDTTPTFYDFGSFEEMQVTTGGTDASIATAGAVLNLVTKRGTNEWRLSARYLFADDRWQPSPDDIDLGAGQTSFEPSPRLERHSEHGVDVGGQVLRDRLWAWGAFNDTDVDLELEPPPTLFDQGSGDRRVENTAFKLDAAIGPANRLQALVHRSVALIEQVGGGPTRALDATWTLDAPTTVHQLEGSHVLGSELHVGAQLSRVDGDLALEPVGRGATPVVDAGGVFRQTFRALRSERRRDQARFDVSAFLGTAGLGHELKAGADRRRAEVASRARWGTEDSVLVVDPSGSGAPTRLFFRPERTEVELDSWSAYLQDTLSIGHLIADVGLRYDDAAGERAALRLDANPLRPDLMPAIAATATDAGFEWETIVPRLGVTWAIGGERTSFLRASWSRFADQLGSTVFAESLGAPGDSPFGSTAVRFRDLDGDTLPDAGEPTLSLERRLEGVVVDPGFDAPITDEVLFSAEHAGAGCFSVGIRLSWRAYGDVAEERALVRDAAGAVRLATSADYVGDGSVTGTLPGGETYAEPVFALRSDLDPLAARFLTNGEREVEYRAATVWFERRLRARWQLRSFFNVRDEQWTVPAEFLRFDDPTDTVGFEDDDGAPLGPSSPFADRADVWLNAEWDYSIAGLYRARYGFNAAMVAHGRQGYPTLYFESVLGSDGRIRRVAVTDEARPRRLEDLHQLDVRLEKVMPLGGPSRLTVSADAFNLLNATPALQRGGDLAAPTGDFLREVVSPRMVRVGIRVEWR
jgi:hypothetical protein